MTNPPFHLFPEFIRLVFEYKKDFIILGSPNKQTDKFVFGKLRDSKMFLGLKVNFQAQFYRVPIGEFDDRFDLTYADVEKYPKEYSSVSWFSSIEIDRGLGKLECWRRYYSDPDYYEHYDNCDAIHIKRMTDIPCDYYGVMGVPVTFWERYDVSEFEVVGMCNVGMFECTKKYTNVRKCKNGKEFSRAAQVNGLLAIKYKEQPVGKYYYTADNCDGYLTVPYMRILVRRKRPGEVVIDDSSS